MNHWCDYTVPLSTDKRPKLPGTDDAKRPLGPGVELDIPTHRSLTPITKQILLHRQQMAERNKRELMGKFGIDKQGVHRLKPVSQSLDTTAYRAENTLSDGSIIIAGRRLVPDPVRAPVVLLPCNFIHLILIIMLMYCRWNSQNCTGLHLRNIRVNFTSHDFVYR